MRDQAERLLPPPALASDCVPTLMVAGLVAGNVRGWCLQGEMRGSETEIQEEGILRVRRGVLAQVPDGMIGDCAGGVVVGLRVNRRELAVIFEMSLRRKVPVVIFETIGTVEPPCPRSAVEVPLPGVVGSVAQGSESLREQARPGRPRASSAAPRVTKTPVPSAHSASRRACLFGSKPS